jgi:hypothetical protein
MDRAVLFVAARKSDVFQKFGAYYCIFKYYKTAILVSFSFLFLCLHRLVACNFSNGK